MWDYSEKVLELFYHPKNQGAMDPSSEPGVRVVVGEVGSITCGDALRLYLKVDEASERILAASFQTFGCTSAIASSSALTELITGLTLDEALRIDNRQIADYLGGLPPAKMHCSVMGQEALEAAIYSYRGLPLPDHTDDDSALVCSCFGVSEQKIRRLIRENHLTSAEEVTAYSKAGGGCGSCLAQIEDLIAAVLAETDATPSEDSRNSKGNSQNQTEPSPAAPPPVSATATPPPLTTLQKIARIQAVLEEEVRPLLLADGGDVELYDLEGDQVWVRLKGSCAACPSQQNTLRLLIETRLQEQVWPTLTVHAL
ncbi:nitrogen fixation protein NifU [Synechococcus sp. 60AY4M2]|jgi:NifU-like protein|uniref:Fe-S cluster assembly protein NifU n=1 Tax=unclassified Synechococcus TaxID=2626047 RepID=UPI000C17C221|nr:MULTISPECIES: Fe-S cluster assembly protein NifU [unclassified Synechococcus]PIK88027.1 nitrogen fixation protein NifU [Synechococcus sp. 65AY6A5]PIK96177.1 nitrogen fixation protein NifU [Synechococcus sp. 60AY4M2]PIK98400.1 nitrogen fixation protein NifU [Synechococcus sp. 63AY4M1]